MTRPYLVTLGASEHSLEVRVHLFLEFSCAHLLVTEDIVVRWDGGWIDSLLVQDACLPLLTRLHSLSPLLWSCITARAHSLAFLFLESCHLGSEN